MKTFEEYINESRHNYIFGGTDDRNINAYNYVPKDDRELVKIINKLLIQRGNDGDFNDIDISNITDMRGIFYKAISFNGDISEWDTSNVTNMRQMFYFAESFNQDISGWDVSNVTDMSAMFFHAYSFNRDISGWDVRNVISMNYMFDACPIKEEYKPKLRR